MSINDPQWGNSHRPDQKDPDQVPESTGTEPVQPDDGQQDAQPQKMSGHQPGSPPEGPPDLEELWQQLVYKTRCLIARLLRREPPAPPVPPSPTSQPIAPIPVSGDASLPGGWQALSLKSALIGVSLIIGAWLMSGFYLVDTQQRGVLSRFGSVVAVEDPGWHWRWPYPIDRVRLVNVTADRVLEIGFTAQQGQRPSAGLMPTADGNLVDVAYAVVYQVTDPVAYLSHADDSADLLTLLAETRVRDAVATQTLPVLLGAGNLPTATADTPLLNTMRTSLQAALDPLQLGVAVKGVQIRAVQLPAPVMQAIKASEREAQARAKSAQAAQTAATDSLIRARQLSATLQDESAAYARALDQEVQALKNADTQIDAAQAQKDLSLNAARWRQQYPLVFASPTALQDRVQTPAKPIQVPTPASTTPSDGPRAETAAPLSPTLNPWPDRELMRSRDRVDRPGSGS